MKSVLIVVTLLGITAIGGYIYLNHNELTSAELPAIEGMFDAPAEAREEDRVKQTRSLPTRQPPPQERRQNSAPTPNIRATIAARVAEELQSLETDPQPELPTPTAQKQPTPLPRPQNELTESMMLELATRVAPRPTIQPRNPATLVARTISTGMGQQVEISVEGFLDNRLRFDQLVQIINDEERLLGIPYPSPKLTVRRGNPVGGGFCGHNEMSYKPRYQGNPYTVEASDIPIRVDEKCNDTFGSIAHEVAHTWFHGNGPQNWIDEGLANSIEIQLKEAHPSEGDNYLPRTYCATHRNIAELETAIPTKKVGAPASGFSCNYTLGDGIFGALREHLGNDTFNQKIAELGRRAVNPNDRTNNVEDVRRVLGVDARALEIIDLWYSGQPDMRIFQHLDLVEYTHPPTLDGQYLHFAGRIKEPGIVHELILGKANFCPQFQVYEGLADLHGLAGLADPLPAGWKHDTIPEISIINSDINPSTREFSITARVNGQQLSQAKDPSLRVASRANIGPDGECEQGTTFSQVVIEKGAIPDELKTVKHYHDYQIAWDWTPQVSNYQIHLSGKAPPGSISFEYRDGFCGQIDLYRMDKSGYHRISSVNPMLLGGQQWTTTPGAEITSGQVNPDGWFEAVVQVWDADLLNHPHVVLNIRKETPLNPATNQCASSDTMGAVSLVGN